MNVAIGAAVCVGAVMTPSDDSVYLIACFLTVGVMALIRSHGYRWLRRRVWPDSAQAARTRTAQLWRFVPAMPRRVVALSYASFVLTCLLAAVALGLAITWLLARAVPTARPSAAAVIGACTAVAAVGALLGIAHLSRTDSEKPVAMSASPTAAATTTVAAAATTAATAANPPEALPVTIVTGYLGAGKSTLVQRILTEEHGSRILVIENELGAVGVDHELLLREAQPEEVVLLSNGCVCCRVRKDLITTLLALRDKLPLLDACLIETTGVADPAALVQTFYAAELRGVCRLDAVLCVVDAKHVRRHLELPRHSHVGPDGRPWRFSALNEVQEQILFADRLLLNKCDLADADELAAARELLGALNPAAPLFETTRGSGVAIDALLNIGAFDPSRHRPTGPGGFALFDAARAPPLCLPAGVPAGGGRRGGDGVRAHSVSIDGEVDLDAFNRWMLALLRDDGELARAHKGAARRAGRSCRFCFQSVYMTFDGRAVGRWEDGEPRSSRMVFIGVDLDAKKLTAGFERCAAAST